MQINTYILLFYVHTISQTHFVLCSEGDLSNVCRRREELTMLSLNIHLTHLVTLCFLVYILIHFFRKQCFFKHVWRLFTINDHLFMFISCNFLLSTDRYRNRQRKPLLLLRPHERSDYEFKSIARNSIFICNSLKKRH